jgi:hypothetical protein
VSTSLNRDSAAKVQPLAAVPSWRASSHRADGDWLSGHDSGDLFDELFKPDR